MSPAVELLTEKEAALALSMSTEWLRKARFRLPAFSETVVRDLPNGAEVGPPFVKVGNRVRYPRVGLERWIAWKLSEGAGAAA